MEEVTRHLGDTGDTVHCWIRSRPQPRIRWRGPGFLRSMPGRGRHDGGAGQRQDRARNMFDVENVATVGERAPIPMSDIDAALTSQLVVAWAGETGEGDRLGWWRCDLVSEYGGEDLFRRLLPSTWRWAVLQGAREAARRVDADLRRQDHDPDRIVSLFSLGFEVDERVEERLRELKGSGRVPHEALPGLDVVSDGWDPDRFWDWVGGHGLVETTAAPAGRRIKGQPPAALDQLARKLVAGLAPQAERYPLPHFRRTP